MSEDHSLSSNIACGLFDAFNDMAAFVVSTDGIILSWNTGAERLLGLTSNEVIGQPLSRWMGLGHDGLESLCRARPVDLFVFNSNDRPVRVNVTVRHFGANFAVRATMVDDDLAMERRVLGAIRDAVVATDEHGVVTYWNEGATHLFGCTASQRVGRPLVERFPVEVRPTIESNIQELLSGVDWDGEFEDYRHDGQRVWIDARVRAVRDSDGKVIGVLGISHDITARKKAEQAETERQRFVKDVLNAMSARVCVVDVDGIVQDVNLTWQRPVDFGLPPSAAHPFSISNGGNYLESCQARGVDGALEREGIVSVLRGEVNYFDLEYPFGLGDKQRWFAVNVSPLGPPHGGAVVAHYDITLRKRTERAEQENRRRLQLALSVAQMGVWSLDLQSGQIKWSPEAHAVIGVVDFDGTVESWKKLIHPADLPIVDRSEKAITSGQQSISSRFRVVPPNGPVRWLENVARVYRDEQGQPSRVIGTVQDVTARVRDEQERAREIEGLRLLSEITDSLLSDQSPDHLTTTVFERIARYLDCDQFYHYQADAEGLRLIASAGISESLLKPFSRLKYGQNLCGEVARTRQTIYIENLASSTYDHAQGARGLGLRVYIGCPLMARGELIGTLALASTRRNQFSDHERGLIQSVSQSVATAMVRLWDAMELRERDSKFRAAIETTQDGFWALDQDGRIIDVNDAYLRLSGFARTDLLNRVFSELESAASMEPLHHRLAAIRQLGSDRFETEHRTRSGEVWPVEVTVTHWPTADHFYVFLRDITERNRVQNAIMGHNRVLAMIATGSELHHTLEEVVKLVESQLPGSMCSIHMKDDSGSHLRGMAGASLPAVYNQSVALVPIGPCIGSCGTAAYRGTPVSVADIANDPLWKDFKHLALPVGLRACVSVPIMASGNVPGHPRGTVLGTFAVYRSSPGPFDPITYEVISGTALAPEMTQRTKQSRQPVVAGAANLAGEAIERFLSERALRESEERFRNVLDFSSAVIYLKGPDSKPIFANHRAQQAFGLDQDRPHGTAIEQLDLRDQQVLVERTSHQAEIHATLPDGSSVTYVSVHFPLFHSDGRLYAVCCIATDVTDRRRTQEERDRLWAQSPDPLCVASLDGRLKQLNPAWAHRLGWADDDLLEHLILDFVHPSDVSFTQQTINRLALGEPIHGLENRFRCQDGSYRWFSWNCMPMLDSQSIYGFIRDVTEEKRLAEQVRQSQKMEAVGQLAGGVAHDFNNLLTVINGYSEMLLASVSNTDPRHEELEAIRDAGERAAALTAQLLAFSRKAIVEPKVVDLNAVVESSSRLLRRLIGEDIRLNIVLGAIPRVKIDPGHLEQVLMNLAVNARDAMPTGGRLTITTDTVQLSRSQLGDDTEMIPGRFARISVSDSGVGMTDDIRARVFEPFFTTKGPGKGTGLGLATVYGIAKQAGGTIVVESEPGRGSTFRVLLPAINGNIGTDETQVSPPPLRGSETVLLVEDEAEVRRLAKLSLEMRGYRVIEASCGSDAIQAVRNANGPIDLLVTDVVMPDIGGRQVADMVRAFQPNVRVLYVSGYTDDAIIRHGVETSEDAFVQKPFTPHTLALRVREVLNDTRRH